MDTIMQIKQCMSYSETLLDEMNGKVVKAVTVIAYGEQALNASVFLHEQYHIWLSGVSIQNVINLSYFLLSQKYFVSSLRHDKLQT